MDCSTYMTNPALCGYKLCNLQYRNDVDTDNRYKVEPIYAEDSCKFSDLWAKELK